MDEAPDFANAFGVVGIPIPAPSDDLSPIPTLSDTTPSPDGTPLDAVIPQQVSADTRALPGMDPFSALYHKQDARVHALDITSGNKFPKSDWDAAREEANRMMYAIQESKKLLVEIWKYKRQMRQIEESNSDDVPWSEPPTTFTGFMDYFHITAAMSMDEIRHMLEQHLDLIDDPELAAFLRMWWIPDLRIHIPQYTRLASLRKINGDMEDGATTVVNAIDSDFTAYNLDEDVHVASRIRLLRDIITAHMHIAGIWIAAEYGQHIRNFPARDLGQTHPAPKRPPPSDARGADAVGAGKPADPEKTAGTTVEMRPGMGPRARVDTPPICAMEDANATKARLMRMRDELPGAMVHSCWGENIEHVRQFVLAIKGGMGKHHVTPELRLAIPGEAPPPSFLYLLGFSRDPLAFRAHPTDGDVGALHESMIDRVKAEEGRAGTRTRTTAAAAADLARAAERVRARDVGEATQLQRTMAASMSEQNRQLREDMNAMRRISDDLKKELRDVKADDMRATAASHEVRTALPPAGGGDSVGALQDAEARRDDVQPALLAATLDIEHVRDAAAVAAKARDAERVDALEAAYPSREAVETSRRAFRELLASDMQRHVLAFKEHHTRMLEDRLAWDQGRALRQRASVAREQTFFENSARCTLEYDVVNNLTDMLNKIATLAQNDSHSADQFGWTGAWGVTIPACTCRSHSGDAGPEHNNFADRLEAFKTSMETGKHTTNSMLNTLWSIAQDACIPWTTKQTERAIAHYAGMDHATIWTAIMNAERLIADQFENPHEGTELRPWYMRTLVVDTGRKKTRSCFSNNPCGNTFMPLETDGLAECTPGTGVGFWGDLAEQWKRKQPTQDDPVSSSRRITATEFILASDYAIASHFTQLVTQIQRMNTGGREGTGAAQLAKVELDWVASHVVWSARTGVKYKNFALSKSRRM